MNQSCYNRIEENFKIRVSVMNFCIKKKICFIAVQVTESDNLGVNGYTDRCKNIFVFDIW